MTSARMDRITEAGPIIESKLSRLSALVEIGFTKKNCPLVNSR